MNKYAVLQPGLTRQKGYAELKKPLRGSSGDADVPDVTAEGQTCF
jgi:hypothetical protein